MRTPRVSDFSGAPHSFYDKSEQTYEKGIKIKLKEENNNPLRDISNVRPIDEECGNTSYAIGEIHPFTVAMEYSVEGVKSRWRERRTYWGFVLWMEKKEEKSEKEGKAVKGTLFVFKGNGFSSYFSLSSGKLNIRGVDIILIK